MPGHLKYGRLILAGALGQFSWGRDLIVGFVMNLATLLLSNSFGLISASDWNAHKWLFVLALILPYIVILIPHIFWRIFKSASDIHGAQTNAIAGIKSEKLQIEAKLKEIDDAKPNIVLCGPVIEPIAFRIRGSMTPIFAANFVKMRFANKPQSNSERCIARGIRAKISFFDSSHKILLVDMDGRWDSTDQPSTRQYGVTRNDLLPMDFGIEEAQNIDVAFWDTSIAQFVAFNNDSYNFLQNGYRKPGHELGTGPVTAEVRLTGVEVIKAFQMTFGVNSAGSIEVFSAD